MARGDGFTLLEIMAALAVVAILIALAIPVFRETLLNTRRDEALAGLTRSLHLARSESLRSGRATVVCSLDATGRCVPRDIDWSHGWQVFVKQDDDDTTRLADSDRLLLEQRSSDGSLLSTNRHTYVYRPFNRRSTNGSFIFCDPRGARSARAVIVSHTGRPRVSDRDSNGKPLTCPEVAP